MLDPDPSARVAATHHAGPPGLAAGPHTLQILMTEHWSLLAARSMGYTEAMSRATMFIAALSGAVVALALVSQATDFGDGFVAFALVLLPVVFVLGVVTVLRIGQVNLEDAVWVQGMNRIRHAYLDIAPELEPYFVTSRYDDDAGVLLSTLARSSVTTPVQVFLALPGVVAMLDAVVAGAIAGIAALGLNWSTGTALGLGAAAFVLAILGFVVYGITTVAAYRRHLVVRFPTPEL